MKEAQVKRRCDDFTLVELLVVICLASLLFGIVLPAFSRMVTGSAVDRLASNLKLRLEQTQSQAAVSRRHTALILPHTPAADPFPAPLPTDSAEVKKEKTKAQAARLGGSRMCFVDSVKTDDGTAEFKGWVPNEEWSQPDRGAFLIRATDAESDVAKEGDLQAVGNGTNAGIATNVVLTGTPLLTVKNCKILDADTDGSDRGSCAVVFSPNGNMRSKKDVYLVVGEAMVNGDKLIFPGGGDAGAHNFRALKINKITGRVEYLSKK